MYMHVYMYMYIHVATSVTTLRSLPHPPKYTGPGGVHKASVSETGMRQTDDVLMCNGGL